MKKLISVLALLTLPTLLVLAGYYIFSPEIPTLNREQSNLFTALIRAGLKDADSVKFGDAVMVGHGSACVSVNAKNGHGGYSGFKAVGLTNKVDNEWYWVDIDHKNMAECVRVMGYF